MTIKNKTLWEQRSCVQAAADNAPLGLYQSAYDMDAAVNDAIEAVMAAFRENGFNAVGNDHCADLEAAIYGYLKVSNPNHANEFTLNEAFGERV